MFEDFVLGIIVFLLAFYYVTIFIHLLGKSDISAADLKRERQLVEVKPSEVAKLTFNEEMELYWNRFKNWLNT